jgi:Zn-finger domain-containing protein
MSETLARMEMALDSINSAIDMLSTVDGMERMMEALNEQAVTLEDEMAELESLLDSEEPDHGEMVEWHDFDPDC